MVAYCSSCREYRGSHSSSHDSRRRYLKKEHKSIIPVGVCSMYLQHYIRVISLVQKGRDYSQEFQRHSDRGRNPKMRMALCHLLSLKFRLHMVTRTPHHQNSNEVTHGTELISQHSRRAKTIQSNQKLKGALHQLDARTCAGQKRVFAHARPTRDCPHKKLRVC